MALNTNAHVQRTFDWLDALELRERILLLLAAVVVLYLAMDSFGLQPTLKAQQIAEQETSAVEMKLSALREQANLLNYKSTEDSGLSRQESRTRLSAELTELDEKILGQLGVLVEPAQAANVLEQVLSNHRRLKMKSLQAHSVPLEQIDSTHQQLAGLSRYQLEFELEGSYLDLLTYLQELESMPWKFFWQNVDFQVADYPRAVTRLQLYTLGGAPHG